MPQLVIVFYLNRGTLVFKGIICFFKEHKKVYWTYKKLEEENAIGGSYTPWTCSRCGYTSDVFRYPKGYKSAKTVRTIHTKIF